jgi:uncharacterized membrane protein required for colicin V production
MTWFDYTVVLVIGGSALIAVLRGITLAAILERCNKASKAGDYVI